MSEQVSKQVEAVNALCEKLRLVKSYSRKQAFQEELIKYLQSKLAAYDIPAHELMEMAQYIMIGNDFVVRDEVESAFRHWNRQIKKKR